MFLVALSVLGYCVLLGYWLYLGYWVFLVVR